MPRYSPHLTPRRLSHGVSRWTLGAWTLLIWALIALCRRVISRTFCRSIALDVQPRFVWIIDHRMRINVS